RSLCDPAANRGGPVPGRRGRSGADRPARGGARADRPVRGLDGSPMRVAHEVGELRQQPRAVAVGTFDGVHLGHRRVLEAAVAAGPMPTVVTFDPHPRIALGYEVELLTTLERRLELIAAVGIEEALVVEFDLELARLGAEEFA